MFTIPLTSTPRTSLSQIEITPDAINGLDVVSGALVEQLRAVAIERCGAAIGNVGAVVAHQIIDVLAMIIGLP